MFVDQVKIQLQAGNGGNGIVAFRREKYVPNGGPAGGDGGHGGNIVFKVDSGLSTLMDFNYNGKFKAKNGGDGQNKKMTGRSAPNLIIKVPEGTAIYNNKTNELICDLIHPNQEYTVAHGGHGGRGNTHFASPKNQAPEIAENGEPGEALDVRLELKVLADVGLVGFPSVGKSTLLSVITKSKPKIAGYHFTTLVPNLGMVRLNDGRDFVIADLPGLIEGASNGVGLGFQFLRHVERTRVILHLVDMSGMEGRDPYDDYQKINQELSQYDEQILKRPQIIVATKMDMPNAEKNLIQFKHHLASHQVKAEVMPISSVTHHGLKSLVSEIADVLAKTPRFPINDEPQPKVEKHQLTNQTPFHLYRDGDGIWILSGDEIEKLFKMTDTEHEQSLMRFSRKLYGMGVDDALRRAGAQSGDTVMILDYQFTYEA